MCSKLLYHARAENEMIDLFVACFRFVAQNVNIINNNIISVEPINLKMFSPMLHLIEWFDDFLKFFSFIHNFIVNRWGGANKDAKNFLFCPHTLCVSYVSNTFLLDSSTISSKQLLCFVFVQGQGQKTEQ